MTEQIVVHLDEPEYVARHARRPRLRKFLKEIAFEFVPIFWRFALLVSLLVFTWHATTAASFNAR